MEGDQDMENQMEAAAPDDDNFAPQPDDAEKPTAVAEEGEPKAADDDFEKAAEEAKGDESESEEKTFLLIPQNYAWVSSVSEEKTRWLKETRGRQGDVNQPLYSVFCQWLFVPAGNCFMTFALLGFSCGYMKDQPLIKKNEYTQRHIEMNTSFYYSLAGFSIFMSAILSVNSLGKFQNKCLRNICEPFLILFKIVSLVGILYFEWKEFFTNCIVRWFYIWKDNWWKNKTDPFLTNASYYNAFQNWFVWLLMLPVMAFILLLMVQLVLGWFIKKCICGTSAKRSAACKTFIQNVSTYLSGYSSKQYGQPFNFNAGAFCPACLSKTSQHFTPDDKVAALHCNHSHWYHRECLMKQLQLPAEDETRLICLICNKDSQKCEMAERMAMIEAMF